MIKRIDKDTIQIGKNLRIKRPERLVNDKDGYIGLQETFGLEGKRWESIIALTKSQEGFDRRLKEFKNLVKKAEKEKNGLHNNEKRK